MLARVRSLALEVGHAVGDHGGVGDGLGGGLGGGHLVLMHALLTAAYAGFQVLVQVVVYRSFPLVPPPAFPAYVRAHQRRIGYVVGPLFAGLLVTTAGLVLGRPCDLPRLGVTATALLLAAVLGLTAAGAVPAHRQLADGFTTGAYRRLLAVDGLRAVAAVANAAVAAGLAWRLGTPAGC